MNFFFTYFRYYLLTLLLSKLINVVMFANIMLIYYYLLYISPDTMKMILKAAGSISTPMTEIANRILNNVELLKDQANDSIGQKAVAQAIIASILAGATDMVVIVINILTKIALPISKRLLSGVAQSG